MAWSVPDPYERALRHGVTWSWSVGASRGGELVAGAQGLDPVGGYVDDDARRDNRRSLTLELAPEPGLFGLLEPTGTLLTVTARVQYLNGAGADIPCGVYELDAENSGEVDGVIRITAPDRWARIRRARFLKPQKSTPTALVRDQIATLIRGALGAAEPVNITATSTATVGVQVWERDRDKAILELARSIGAWVFFDREGTATVADVPTIGAAADWTIDQGAEGVLIDLDRQRSRERTYNVVVASTSRLDGVAAFDPQIVWDSDPTSPTYAGTDPVSDPDSAGPFGIVPYFYESPLLRTAPQAAQAATGILYRVTGLASQISLGSVPNPALDALDVIDVDPPDERHDIPRPVERHMVDKVVHSFDPDTPVRIEGRSTRTDEFS